MCKNDLKEDIKNYTKKQTIRNRPLKKKKKKPSWKTITKHFNNMEPDEGQFDWTKWVFICINKDC